MSTSAIAIHILVISLLANMAFCLTKWTYVQDVQVHGGRHLAQGDVEHCLEECESSTEPCQGVIYDNNWIVCNILSVPIPDGSLNIVPRQNYDFYYICAFGELGKPDKSYWEKIPDHSLVGSSRIAAASPEECQRICEEDLSCRSMNYYESSPECGINTNAWGDKSGIDLKLQYHWNEKVDYYYYCARPERRPVSFVVPLDCREDLARTPDLPACGVLDLTYRRLPCQLREPADTRALYAVAAVSGDIELPRTGSFSVPVICAALDQSIYYCVGGTGGAPENLAFDESCPFKNITKVYGPKYMVFP